MPPPSTLYRFEIELSDIDRNVYQTLDFRAAQHPSESVTYLVTRVLAFALSFEEGLGFSPEGLSDPDAPCLRALDENGATRLWIEIGNPNPRKLHRASKASRQVKVFTYKNPELLLEDLRGEPIHKREEIEIFSLSPKFLDQISSALTRHNKWQLVHDQGTLMVNIVNDSVRGEIKKHPLT